MINWKNIHQDFTPELQKEWEERGFNYEGCQSWIKFGCQPYEADLADYLQECRKNWFNSDIEVARIEYPNWKNLGFTPKVIIPWKNRGFTAEQTGQWIKVGLKVNEYDLVEEWKERGFTPEQTKEWLASGLRLQDSAYCTWVKK